MTVEERAREFCKGAFAAFGVDTEPYAKVVAELIQGAVDAETARLRHGLQIIKQAGAVHGGAWCVAQARGHLEDLDFDHWPDTGRPPAIDKDQPHDR